MASEDFGLGALVSLRDRFSGPAQTIAASSRLLEGQMASTAVKVTASIRTITMGLALVGAGAIGMRAALSPLPETIQFQRAMNDVAARLGSNVSPAFVQLRKDAIDLGSSTAFTATQVAGAQSEMAKAGFTSNQIMKAQPGLIALAATENMSLAQATEIAASALKQFSLDASQTGKVADVLAVAANETLASVAGLGTGLTYVGPIAASFNKNLEETVAAMALLSDRGIDASMSGTSLRQVFADLAKPTKEAQKALAAIGIKVDEVAPSTHTLAQIVHRFNVAGADMNDVLKIMDVRAANAFATLLEIGSPALLQLQDRLEGSGGAAQKMADLQLAGLPGAIKRVDGALNALNITLGTPMSAPLDTLLRGFADVVKGVTDFAATHSLLTKFVTVGLMVVSTMLIVAGAFVTAKGMAMLFTSFVIPKLVQIGVLTVAAGTKMTIFGTLSRLAMSGIGLAAGGLIAALGPLAMLAGAFMLLDKVVSGGNKNSITAGVIGIGDKIGMVFGGLSEIMGSFDGNVGRMSKSTADKLRKAGLLDITVTLFGAFERFKALGSGLFEGIGGAIEAMASTIRGFLPDGTALARWFDDVIAFVETGRFSSSIEDFNEWGKAIGYVTGFIGALWAINASIGAITFALGPVKTAWEIWGAAAQLTGKSRMAFLFGIAPEILVIAGAVMYLTERWDALTQAFRQGGIFGAMKLMFADMQSSLADAIEFVDSILPDWLKANPDKTAQNIKNLRWMSQNTYAAMGMDKNGKPLSFAGPPSPTFMGPPVLTDRMNTLGLDVPPPPAGAAQVDSNKTNRGERSIRIVGTEIASKGAIKVEARINEAVLAEAMAIIERRYAISGTD